MIMKLHESLWSLYIQEACSCHADEIKGVMKCILSFCLPKEMYSNFGN